MARVVRQWTYDSANWSVTDLINAAYEVLTHEPASVADLADRIGDRYDVHVPFRLIGVAVKSLRAEGLAVPGGSYTFRRGV